MSRKANVTYLPETDHYLPWNVGLYDGPAGDEYNESVGAVDHSDAMNIADAWVTYDDNRFHRLTHY
jgi:hypothetical protein